MAQAPNATQEVPAESKFSTVIRAVGFGVLVLVLWFVDRIAVARLPAGSVWRYVVSGVIVFVGLIAVLSISDRISHKNP
jgi:hypothetical protein